MIQEAALREIRLAMARAGLDVADLVLILAQKLDSVSRKRRGKLNWTLEDVGKICKATGHQLRLIPKGAADDAVELLEELRRSAGRHGVPSRPIEDAADPPKGSAP